MQPITVTAGPLDPASADAIAVSQTVTGAANVVINGVTAVSGVAYFDVPRARAYHEYRQRQRHYFTVYGTWIGGQTISETVQGTSGSSVATTLDFATVTRVATSGSTSVSGITVGTNGVAGSRWVALDDFAPGQITVQASVGGTANYSIQTTLNDPNDPFSPVLSVPLLG